jgi:EAL domain-containing protein (putative c-di-GMP-specific phosphodiesterase class I)/ABC-type amino acid transport substrate-binding protein/GGDEF domain-containing protein
MVLAATLLLSVFLILISSEIAQAAESKVVRVAFFPMTGFHEYSSDGSRTGMDVDYLNSIQSYTGWQIEYVDCQSWDDALSMLEDNEVDLVGSAQYSEARSKLFCYARFPSGYTYGAIMINADTVCAFEDFDAMANLTYGVVSTYIRKEEFLEYLSDNGITDPVVVEYPDTAHLQAAIDAGEVDAIVHTYMEIDEGQQIIGRFSPAPFYYIANKENQELINELDQAISELKMENPLLENNLMSKYYSHKLYQSRALTSEEQAYVGSLDSLVVGYLDGNYPFSYEQGGEFCGLSREVFDTFEENTGLTLTYQKADSMEQALSMLQEGTIDVLSFSLETKETLLAQNLLQATIYASVSSDILSESDQLENAFDKKSTREWGVSAVIRQEDQEQLAGVLDKCLESIDYVKINEYLRTHTIPSDFAIGAWLQEHELTLTLAASIIVVIILLVVTKLLMDSKKMQQLLYKDEELGIWNLNYLTYTGRRFIESDIKKHAIVYVNMAQFRTYSTLYGWHAGNRLLQFMADLLLAYTNSKHEICARVQGDRFAMLLHYTSRLDFTDRLAEIQNQLEQQIHEKFGIHMVIHMGVYYIPLGRYDIKAAIDMANQAVESMRECSVSEIRVYDTDMDQQIRLQHEREELLERADIDHDFTVYYQGKVDIRTQKIVGAEALVRFYDPADPDKVLAPGYFVPYYEKTGQICEIDFFVLNQVCIMLRKRLDAHKEVVPVSCNFSRRHFALESFPDQLEEVLNRHQIPKDLIEVEITETMVIEERAQQQMKETLLKLKERGFRLSIDDFGAGYSSLGIFEQVPASVIKLDRSFFTNHADPERQEKIMQQIVRLANELDTQIVCEGVENIQDVELMHRIGAYVAQGYYYARPVPSREFEQRLEAN